nr:M23 family metallopeptidase [bacterium]
IVAEEGAPVKAASEGRVIVSEWFTDYGNTIVLYHGFGFFSVYKHLQFRLKETDDAVKTGEVIGTVGRTGRLATGIHLHFEIWRDGVPRDPATFIPQIRDALVITVKADSLAKKSS